MIIVTGAKGMLGRHVVQRAEAQGEKALPLGHADLNIADGWQVFNWAQAWGEDDILINCAGIPGDIADPWAMVQTNSLGPHYLAAASKKYGFRLVHVSTDCVFSGWERGVSPKMRQRFETPNPDSFYGRTKLAGEPSGPRVSVVRTSFVGPDHGLQHWLQTQEREAIVVGWRNAFWSGSTVEAVAYALLATSWTHGLTHLCTETPITKATAVTLLARYLGRDDLRILSGGPLIDRSMSPDIILPSLEDALAERVAHV